MVFRISGFSVIFSKILDEQKDADAPVSIIPSTTTLFIVILTFKEVPVSIPRINNGFSISKCGLLEHNDLLSIREICEVFIEFTKGEDSLLVEEMAGSIRGTGPWPTCPALGLLGKH